MSKKKVHSSKKFFLWLGILAVIVLIGILIFTPNGRARVPAIAYFIFAEVLVLMYIVLIYTNIQIVKRRNKVVWLVFNIISYVVPYIAPIFLIIYWSAGKDSVKDDELRNLQIELLKKKLKKGDVDLKMTGKMRKLK